MRAKLVNENVSDVLTPKSKEDILKAMHAEFEKRNKATLKEAKKVAAELNELGVEATVDDLSPERQYIPSGEPINLYYWTIYDSNSHLTNALTKEYAEKIFLALKTYAFPVKYLTLNEPEDSLSSRTYISVKEAREIIHKLRHKIPITMKGEFVNKSDKWDHPGYDEWYQEKGRDLMKKRIERGEEID
jgi:hypothetical protein